jgi:hypothetical protein
VAVNGFLTEARARAVRPLAVLLPQPDPVDGRGMQAPIILMSQNGQANRDRAAAALDYDVNLTAELEIMGTREARWAAAAGGTERAHILECIHLLCEATSSLLMCLN